LAWCLLQGFFRYYLLKRPSKQSLAKKSSQCSHLEVPYAFIIFSLKSTYMIGSCLLRPSILLYGSAAMEPLKENQFLL